MHTKGPWIVANGTQVWKDGHNTVTSPRICTLENASDPVEQLSKGEMIDNAYLIAAAPELLEACKKLIETLDHSRKHTCYDENHFADLDESGCFNEIRQAIARAEGK